MDGDVRARRKVSADTEWAVDHPAAFAFISCAAVAAFGIVVVGDFRAVVPMTIAAPIVCWCIWRPRGPVARRVREKMRVEQDGDS